MLHGCRQWSKYSFKHGVFFVPIALLFVNMFIFLLFVTNKAQIIDRQQKLTNLCWVILGAWP